MKKDRFGRYLPIMTAVTAMAFYPAVSNALATTDETKSALSDAAQPATTPLERASADISTALLSPEDSNRLTG
jgi:hypothetical protein